MATPAPELVFNVDFDPRTGDLVEVGPGIGRVTAPNRSAYTFTGTNSYLLGGDRLAVVDPGPESPPHLQALLRAIADRPVEAILLTHTHKDHSALARQLAARVNAPIWLGGPHRPSRPRRPLEIDPIRKHSDLQLVPDRVLRDSERFDIGQLSIEVLATPGHCANHLAFGVAGTPHILTGDHVMGWSSTLVPVPDGSMADYLHSLERLIAAPYVHYLPGHGGPIADGPSYARALLAHRQLRNRQILDLVRQEERSIGQLLAGIYPRLSPGLRMAARMTVQAHVEYLEQRGELRVRRSLFGSRIAAAG